MKNRSVQPGGPVHAEFQVQDRSRAERSSTAYTSQSRPQSLLRKSLRRSAWWLMVPAMALLLVGFVLPLAEMAGWSSSLATYQTALGAGPYRGILFNTFELSLVIAVVATVLGYPVAYFLNRCSARWQTILLLMVLTPLWVSILIRTYSWIVVLGREGIVNSVLIATGAVDEPVRLLYTRFAVYVATIQVMLPIAILMMFSAMGGINQSLMAAARILGATPFRAFIQVFLPLSLNGAISGAMLIFVLSLGFFITPALVGGPKDTMIANIISTQVSETMNWELGAALGVVLLGAGLIVVALIGVLGRRFTSMTAEGGSR